MDELTVEPTRQEQRFRLLVRCAAALALLLFAGMVGAQLVAARPDQAFVVLLLIVIVFRGGREASTFLIDWSPFLIFVMLYDMMRGVAPMFYSRVHVAEPYDLEVLLLGSDSDVRAS